MITGTLFRQHDAAGRVSFFYRIDVNPVFHFRKSRAKLLRLSRKDRAEQMIVTKIPNRTVTFMIASLRKTSGFESLRG
jgi:hypothetical protein